MDGKKGEKMRACEDGIKGKKEAKIKMLLMDLPTGMIMEILSWLPLKSVFKCRCVCKTWLQIISNPHFAKVHLSRSPITILMHNEYPEREARYLHMFQVVEALDHDSGFIQIEETIFRPRLNLPVSPFNLVRFCNSCNGLVLLCGTERKVVYVCNPVLGEFITIKVHEEDNRDSKVFCFGFSVKTNQYKVLQTFDVNGEGPKAEVYTVGTGSWTSLGNAPFSIRCTRFNTFVHGASHWAWIDYSNDHKIGCFDFDKDVFREVPAPPQYKPQRGDSLMLGVIEDSLCACCYRDDGSYQFDIWIMKDYGVKESWTAQFSIKNVFLPSASYHFYYPLILLKNGRLLMSHNDQVVVCYNLKEECFKKTDICAKTCLLSIIAYTPCFVSLKDVAKGEQISRRGKPINMAVGAGNSNGQFRERKQFLYKSNSL